MILGLHLPVRGGYAAVLEAARAHGVAAVQLLPYARHHEPTPEELAAFKDGRAALARVLVHSRFVPSLASSDPERRGRSVRHLARELELAAALGADAFVLHAGAYSPGEDAGGGVKLFAESVKAAGGRVRVLLENVPGGGRRMGGTLEELARLREALPGAGVCLDTAHAHAAGYDLSGAEGVYKFIARAHRLLGTVDAFHVNDTRAPLGSHLEDHRHLGAGRLGEGLAALLSRPEFAGVPGILEPPRGDFAADAAALTLARALITKGTGT
ncbi:MAG: TIM barrel protein [Elusimicrobiota bacterium]|nr:TIM barrel protein [Elusimicrobiota bacterium]